MRWETADGVIDSRRAAASKLPSSRTAAKAALRVNEVHHVSPTLDLLHCTKKY